MNPKLKIISSMMVFGTLAVFVRNISLSSGEIALFRAIIAAISIIIYKFILKEKLYFFKIKKELPILFISGVAIAFNWIFLFQAYKYTTVSIATLSYYFAPILVTLACTFLFKEKLTVKQIFCFIMATVGLMLVIGVNGAEKSGNSFIGIAFGLAAAVLYASVVIFNKYIKLTTGIDKTLIQFFAAIIILFPYLYYTKGIHIGNLNSIGILNLLILGVVHTGLCYCLYFSSLKDLKGQEASIYSYIDPLVAIIISLVILKEKLNIVQLIGGIMILGFTLLNEINIDFKKIKKLIVQIKTK